MIMDWTALLPEMRAEVRARLTRTARRLLALTCKEEDAELSTEKKDEGGGLIFSIVQEHEDRLRGICVRGALTLGWPLVVARRQSPAPWPRP